jgi:hypothetical protein
MALTSSLWELFPLAKRRPPRAKSIRIGTALALPSSSRARLANR